MIEVCLFERVDFVRVAGYKPSIEAWLLLSVDDNLVVENESLAGHFT